MSNKPGTDSKNTATSVDGIIKTHPLVFVTRDIERAMGRRPGDGYYVITNSTAYSESIKLLFPDHVFTITQGDKATGELLDTIDILELESTAKIIESLKVRNILVFKNTSRIEQVCKEKGWNLINPGAKLADRIESKISQVEWLKSKNLDKYLPEHFVAPVSEILNKIQIEKSSYVVQFNHGHTGEGTVFIRKAADLDPVVSDFPKREARVTKFVSGPMFTVNCVVADANKSGQNSSAHVIVGNISYQITGLAPFTDHEGTTIGNDWALTGTILDDQAQESIHRMATDIGTRLGEDGWKGLFGIDVVFDFTSNTPYLIEINARQPASTTYESIIQSMFKRAREDSGDTSHVNELTIFDAHITALLLDINVDKKNPATDKIKTAIINDGAQIIQRATKDFIKTQQSQESEINSGISIEYTINLIRENAFGVIEYAVNEANGADVLRIQSPHGIMSGHELFNSRGKIIQQALEALIKSIKPNTKLNRSTK